MAKYKCAKCGEILTVEDGLTEIYCEFCGQKLRVKKKDEKNEDYVWICSKCGVTNPLAENVCSGCGHENEFEGEEWPYPMNWFWWVTKVMWILTSISLIFSGIRYMENSEYIIGIFCFGIMAYVIYVRFQLVKFKKNAPKLFLFTYVLSIIPDLLTLIYIASVAPYAFGEASLSLLPYIIANSIALVLNYFYFRRRKSLFVN